jgi:hypothetical protein
MPAVELNWVESAGGPLLVVPEDLVAFWEGIRQPPSFRVVEAEFRWTEGGTATDYDRACDIQDYVGVIPVGPGQAIVLADEPLPTTWISGPDNPAGYIVRWVHAPDDESVLRALQELPIGAPWFPGPEFRHDGGRLVVFDSAAPGDDQAVSRLVLELPGGDYELETLRYQPDEDVRLLIHRLRKRA